MKLHIAPLLTRAALTSLLIALTGCTADPSSNALMLEDANMFVSDFLRQIIAALLL